LLFALTAILILSAITQVSAQGNPGVFDVKEFSFTPSTIDTTNSSATVTVTIHVTDSERDVTSIQVNFRRPGGSSQFVSVGLDSRDRISGNARDGVYSKAVVFPQYSAAGTWTVYVFISDGENSRGFSFANSLQVISNNQDIVAPEISEFSFTPSTIDTTKGSQNVTITFRATDAISGISGIYVSFNRPNDYDDEAGYRVYFDSTNRISGDAKDGVYRAVVTIPQNALLGIYDVYVFISDALGNGKSLFSSDLTARGFPSQLRITATTTARRTLFDFDGDGKADISVFRPSNRTWYFQQSANGFTGFQFGDSTDKLVPADFDGDGKTDIAVWREDAANPDRAYFYILNSLNNTVRFQQFGRTGDSVSAVADWDGDGKADISVYRAGTNGGQSYFFYRPSTLPSVDFISVPWGSDGDKPVVADYDGDGRADAAVYRPSNGVWYILKSRDGFSAVQFGNSTDKPVVGDYDGDGKADFAVYRPSEGNWYQLRSTEGFYAVQFGNSTDLPTPADYDGDGKTDVSVFRLEGNNWYQLRSTLGFNAIQFGANGDRPIPNDFVP
jgi:hypothetical protein